MLAGRGAAPAAILDFALLLSLVAAGSSLAGAQLASFAAAAALRVALALKGQGFAATRGLPLRAMRALLAAALLALCLRAGVLAQASLVWDWPLGVATALAVLIGTAALEIGIPLAVSPQDRTATAARGIAILVMYAFALRLVYADAVDLMPEETYYWNYAQHLDYGYLDHPPLTAWLIKLGVALFGNDPFGVRFAALLSSAVAALYVHRLSRNIFGPASARCALLLAQTLPFFFLAGFLTTPDAALTAAWAASLYYLERALIAGEARAWYGAGLALGLGMISKYSIGLLVPVIVLFMLLDAPARAWWRRPQPYLGAVLALAVFSPVIVWNAQHDWASFAFQTSRRLAEAPRFALHKLIASALVLITPIGVAAVAVALRRGADAVALSAPPENPATGGQLAARRWRFLRFAVLVPLTVFTAFSLRHEVKLDWTGAPWVAALPFLGAIMAGGRDGAAGWLRRASLPTVLVLLLLFGVALQYLALGLPGVGYGKHIELVPVAWREFSRQVEALATSVRTQTGRTPVIVGMDRYAIASELEFQAVARTGQPIHPSSAHLFGGVGLMYERWSPAASLEGATLLLIGWERADLSAPAIEAHCESVQPVMEGVLTQDGKPVRHYYFRLAYNYHSRERS